MDGGQVKVLLSGVHSGPNPSPGIGTARSIRAAFPDAELVAVDYSARSSGLHDAIWDDVWLARPWDELDLDLHAQAIRERLGRDGLWVSGLDVEIVWLARQHSDIPGTLLPTARALTRTGKPAITAHRGLGFSVPPFVSTTESDWELHRFCRRFGWRVWLKGPYHEAFRIGSWPSLLAHRADLESRWSSGELFLQADVTGIERSISFAGCGGRLLSAVWMTKRETTSEGKTWAGRIEEVAPDVRARLERVTDDLAWTGGGEVECVQDARGVLWVIDWNPRFPAWIHGATLAGHNLPADLLAAATGEQPRPASRVSGEFTRVVYEIPVRPELPLPALADPAGTDFRMIGKHPSATTELAKRLDADAPRRRSSPPTPIPETVLDDVAAMSLDGLVTPARVLLPRTAAHQFAAADRAASEVTRAVGIPVSVAYSIKTSPDAELMEMALDCGMLAEGISAAEVRSALRTGFAPERIVLNGPAKSWSGNGITGADLPALKVTFSDSWEELRELARDPRQRSVGIRLRPPGLRSRFGVAYDLPDTYERMLRAVRSAPAGRPLAIHFHMASNVVGVLDWWTLFESAVESAAEIARSTRRPVVTLDVGGGWFPDDWFSEFTPALAKRLKGARTVLPELGEVILEPGKALTQPVHALVVRVLQIRANRGSGPVAARSWSTARSRTCPRRTATRTACSSRTPRAVGVQ
jgi:diaminopimelate decarboxylase